VCFLLNIANCCTHSNAAQALDTGEDLPTLDQRVLGVEGKTVAVKRINSWSETCLSVADTLLEFLGSLTEPIVPFVLQENSARATNRDEAFEVCILRGLSHGHRLTSFF
jgi:hypothetical protein